MTLHDWFAGLLTTGQWLTIFLVLGVITSVIFAILYGGDPGGEGSWVGGLVIPFAFWLGVMGILHVIDFLIALWMWDYVPSPPS